MRHLSKRQARRLKPISKIYLKNLPINVTWNEVTNTFPRNLSINISLYKMNMLLLHEASENIRIFQSFKYNDRTAVISKYFNTVQKAIQMLWKLSVSVRQIMCPYRQFPFETNTLSTIPYKCSEYICYPNWWCTLKNQQP